MGGGVVVVAPLAGVSGVIDSPYRGLSAFEERDAAFFFGREAAATQVLERMSWQLNGTGLLVVDQLAVRHEALVRREALGIGEGADPLARLSQQSGGS